MYEPLKIKVCGLRDPENIEQVCSLYPDLVGFIFYPGSKRYVGEVPDPAIFTIPPEGIERVGVFVNEEISRVYQIFETCRLDMVQLHGSESAEYCKSLADTGITVIKVLDAVSLGSLENQENKQRHDKLEGYVKYVRYFLFDSPGEGYGGTGLKFNWELTDGYTHPVPFLLSGGIGPGDEEAIRGLGHSCLHGIDVNSKFELSPGLKDVGILEEFIRKIRK